MIAKLQCVLLDCADVVGLSRFYQSLLGGFVPAFQRVDTYQPPRWPDSAHPQQFLLDLEVKDLEQAQEDALKRGAALPGFVGEFWDLAHSW